jgi:neutral ceramidase
LVADRIVETTGIGADRLFLAATHTHSAPSHFFAAKLYNDWGASVVGFDSVLVEFLVSRIAAAVSSASADLRPARAAWGAAVIWGQTRNRSYEAFVLNSPQAFLPIPSGDLDLAPSYRAVDPVWTMLRVDLFNPVHEVFEPAGAFSIFAIHGTAMPAANDLLDADVHGYLQRGLERHIDSLNGREVGFRPQAVHLVANGTAGDISPNWSEPTRCGAYELRSVVRPSGPRTPPEAEGWCAPAIESMTACLAVAQVDMEAVGSSLRARAIALYDSLGTELRDDLRLGHAFRTVPLQGDSAPEALCDKPKVGTAAIGGAADGYTRNQDWRFLGLFPIGYEQGGSAVKESNKSCQGPKRVALYPFQSIAAGPHGFPEVAQISVLRVGEMHIGTVPAEVTVTAGARMKEAMIRQVGDGETMGDSALLMTLTNGYLQYVTTREEYAAQRYEGAATIYGPGTADAFEEQLADLVVELDDARSKHGGDAVAPIIAYPGKHRSIVPSASAGPPMDRITRAIERLHCSGDTVIVRWVDAYPGRLVPADGSVIRIESERRPADWVTEVWDDDTRLEVRAIKPLGDRGYLWEAKWTPAEAKGTYRVVLVARLGVEAATGQPFRVCR